MHFWLEDSPWGAVPTLSVLLCRQEQSWMSLWKLLSFVQTLFTELRQTSFQVVEFYSVFAYRKLIYHMDYNLDLHHHHHHLILFWSFGFNPITNPSDREYVCGECVRWLGRPVWDCIRTASNKPVKNRVKPDPSTGKYWILAFLFPYVKGSSGFLPRLPGSVFGFGCVWFFGCSFFGGVLFYCIDLSTYLLGTPSPPPEVDFPCVLALLVCCLRGGGPSAVGTVLCTVN